MFANPKAQSLFSLTSEQGQQQLGQSLQELTYQQALYTEFSDQRLCFKEMGYDQQYGRVLGICGFMLEEKDIKVVRLHLVKVLHELAGEGAEGVALVYFSKGELKPKAKRRKYQQIDFSTFKEQILKKLPLKYVRTLKNVYICHQGLLARSLSLFSFTKFTLHSQLIDALCNFCASLQVLVKQLGPLFESELVCQQVQEYNSSGEWLQVHSELEKKAARKKMLQLLGNKSAKSSIYFHNMGDYPVTPGTRIPLLLTGLLQAMEASLTTEGIFRLTCEQQKLTSLQQDLKECTTLEHIISAALRHDGITVACCIKTFFNRLNPPIVGYQVYVTIVTRLGALHGGQGPKEGKNQLPVEEANQLLEYLVASIGPQEKAVLLRLVQFFRGAVIANEKRNKMSPYNLSVVIAPCIFRPQQYSVADLMNSSRLACLFAKLITDHTKLCE